MTLRTGHGTGAGEPRIEVLPPNEQPAPVPGLAPPLCFRQNGQIGDKETAKLLGAKGGKAKAANRRPFVALGLCKLAEAAAFLPYRTFGDTWVAEHLAELAGAAGGHVAPGPASIVCSAGVQLAASRFFSDKAALTGDPSLFALASSLANASRQNLLAAYELAVREAEARRKRPNTNVPWLAGGSK